MAIDFTDAEHIEFDGEIADVVIWCGCCLSDEDRLAILSGVDPRTIRPDKIVELP